MRRRSTIGAVGLALAGALLGSTSSAVAGTGNSNTVNSTAITVNNGTANAKVLPSVDAKGKRLTYDCKTNKLTICWNVNADPFDPALVHTPAEAQKLLASPHGQAGLKRLGFSAFERALFKSGAKNVTVSYKSCTFKPGELAGKMLSGATATKVLLNMVLDADSHPDGVYSVCGHAHYSKTTYSAYGPWKSDNDQKPYTRADGRLVTPQVSCRTVTTSTEDIEVKIPLCGNIVPERAKAASSSSVACKHHNKLGPKPRIGTPLLPNTPPVTTPPVTTPPVTTPPVVTPPVPPAPTLKAGLAKIATINSKPTQLVGGEFQFYVSLNNEARGGIVSNGPTGQIVPLGTVIHVGDTLHVCEQPNKLGFVPVGLPADNCQSHTFVDADATTVFVFTFNNAKTATAKCAGLTTSNDDLNATATATYTASNAVLKSSSFVWGDSPTATAGTPDANNTVTASHKYATANTYPVTATLVFSIPGSTDTITTTCSAPVTVKCPPQQPPAKPCPPKPCDHGDKPKGYNSDL